MTKKKVILIGASGTLGKYFFENLAKDKNISIICGADNNLKTDLKSKNKKFELDLSKEMEIKKFFEKLKKLYGKFDCLINNAAYTTEAALKENKFKKKDYFNTNNWRKNVDINLTGVFLSIKYFFEYHNDKKKLQKIITTGSIYGSNSPDHTIYEKENFFSTLGYTSTKAGLIGLNKWLSKKFASQNIRSNLISPGGVFNKHSRRFQKNYLKNIPLKRMANQKDIYEVLKFLIDDGSNYINGENIHVDGGFSA
ncbi:MAG: hypothetical protein CBC25_00595 [Pelagibacteraceae bacterium TMED65]|nr:MAG: hypothetical protein CBC25_00595 [Pelagibacteraceae bacterium TMED65]|tara:strand:+ start:9555 stop:10313 length:759 start_codon:yes stop_codon:yes gene_type:complete